MKVESRIMRWLGLLAAGAIGVHELRYVLGPGAHAHGAFSSQAHAYLPLAGALALLLFVAAAAQFVASLRIARSGEAAAPKPPGLRRAWALATVALLAIFVIQESLEGALLGGHQSGLHGLFGHGGWSVFVFAPLLALLIAFLLRGAQKAIELAVQSSVTPARRRPARKLPMRPPLIAAPRLRPLARHLAGRAPPLRAS
jgi:hypothetical protein